MKITKKLDCLKTVIKATQRLSQDIDKIDELDQIEDKEIAFSNISKEKIEKLSEKVLDFLKILKSIQREARQTLRNQEPDKVQETTEIKTQDQTQDKQDQTQGISKIKY